MTGSMLRGRASQQGLHSSSSGCQTAQVPPCTIKASSSSKPAGQGNAVSGTARRGQTLRSHAAPAAAPAQQHQVASAQDNTKPTRVLITGAGIGGLVLGVALLKRGFHVKVLERDVTAIRGEGKYRGPIQVTI